MAQLISDASNSEYTDYDTLIPSLTETASIVEAFRLYHYGKANFTDGSEPAANSIHSHLKAIQDSITALENEVGGGHSVSTIVIYGRLNMLQYKINKE